MTSYLLLIVVILAEALGLVYMEYDTSKLESAVSASELKTQALSDALTKANAAVEEQKAATTKLQSALDEAQAQASTASTSLRAKEQKYSLYQSPALTPQRSTLAATPTATWTISAVMSECVQADAMLNSEIVK